MVLLLAIAFAFVMNVLSPILKQFKTSVDIDVEKSPVAEGAAAGDDSEGKHEDSAGGDEEKHEGDQEKEEQQEEAQNAEGEGENPADAFEEEAEDDLTMEHSESMSHRSFFFLVQSITLTLNFSQAFLWNGSTFSSLNCRVAHITTAPFLK